MKQFLFLLFLLSGYFLRAQTALDKNDLELLKNMMEGYYDSQEQSGNDLNYQNIQLRIKQFELKGKSPAGYWLYAEYAISSHPDEPYKQRIYHISKENKETISLAEYELKYPLRFTGAWQNTALLKKIRIDSLTEKSGCTVYLSKDEKGIFNGSTTGDSCASLLHNAAYTASHIKVYPAMITIWERGFDKENHQVWGPVTEGYRFRKWTTGRRP